MLILDGALGTELERRGFSTRLPLWSADALIEAPDLIWEIHCDYVDAGADIITTATFRTTRHTLAKTGLAARAEELTHQAVRIARSAGADMVRPVLVAGSMAPLEDCYRPGLAPDDETLTREHGHTAHMLAEAGVDLILVETQNSAREAVLAARAALETKLPVWVSLMPRSAEEMFNGDNLIETAKLLHDMRCEAILVNCCPPAIAQAAFDRLSEALPRARLGVYPNFSSPAGLPWEFGSPLSPEEFGAWGKRMAEAGAEIIGGCCGTTPDHIAALCRMRDQVRT